MVNKVILIGNLGKDPELKYTANGKAVCNFSIATTERWVDGEGNKQEKTEWHSIVAWGKQAESCGKYLAKGRTVYVEGRLTTRSWDGKDGVKHYKTEVVAENVRFLGGGQRGEQEEKKSDASQDGKEKPKGEAYDDDMPF